MTTTTTNITRPITARKAPQTGFGLFFEMMAVRRSRRDLANADDHILNDIGITRAAAEHEAKQPFWSVPSHWRARR